MSKLIPKYTIWEAINAAISVSVRALEEIRTLARTPGPQGPAGRDGFGFDDLSVVETDKGCMIRFKRGDQVSEFRLPVMTYQGVFTEGKTYRRGDTVTWGGSLWHCDAETTDKPDGGKNWRLAAKRGRDGKDGTIKPPPKPGPVKVG